MDKFLFISYALQFSSFLLEKKKIAEKIDNIILFGSMVSGNFDEESDIDIFVDTDEKNEEEINKELYAFNKSKYYDYWKLKGLKNEISLKIGRLEKWKELKREIISNSIVLYGKFNSKPDKLKHLAIVKINTSNFLRKKQVLFWRKLYGYKQKIGKKIYTSEGLMFELNGKKLDKGIILLPYEKINRLYEFLDSNKIKYETYEIWSDVL